MKEKKEAKREKGGFQTEHLHAEDYWAVQGLQRLFNSTQGKTEVPKHSSFTTMLGMDLSAPPHFTFLEILNPLRIC